MADKAQQTELEAGIDSKLDALLRVLSQLLEVAKTNGEKLDLLVKDATEEKPPSPIVTVLSELVESINEQSQLLAGLPSALVKALDGIEDQDSLDDRSEK